MVQGVHVAGLPDKALVGAGSTKTNDMWVTRGQNGHLVTASSESGKFRLRVMQIQRQTLKIFTFLSVF